MRGIEANDDRCLFYAESSASIATVLAPRIGYAKTAEIVKEVVRTKKNLREVLKKHQILNPSEIEKLLHLFPYTRSS